MDMQEFLTPIKTAALESAAEALKKLNEMLTEELEQAIKALEDAFKQIKEAADNIVFLEREKYTPCHEIGKPRAAYFFAKLWRRNKALFRPYKRGI